MVGEGVTSHTAGLPKATAAWQSNLFRDSRVHGRGPVTEGKEGHAEAISHEVPGKSSGLRTEDPVLVLPWPFLASGLSFLIDKTGTVPALPTSHGFQDAQQKACCKSP